MRKHLKGHEQTVMKGLPASSDVIAEMAKIADRKGEALQGVVDRVLQQYITYDNYLEEVKYPLVTLPGTTVHLLLEHVPDAAIEGEGYKVGVQAPPQFLTPMGHLQEFNDLRFYLEELKDKRFKVYKVSFQSKGDGFWRVNLTHTLGRKWSIFTLGYLKGMFLKCASVEDPEVTDVSVTVNLQELHVPKRVKA